MKLSFIDEGKGSTLVFIHSYLLQKEIWQKQIDFLKKEFRCIAIDLPCHGESDNFKDFNEISLKNIAKEIINLLHDLKIDKYHCIGISSGSFLLPYIYSLEKEKILSLTMINTYLENEGESIKKLFLSFLNTAKLYNSLPKTLIEQITPLFFSNPSNEDLQVKFLNKLETLHKENLNNFIKLGEVLFDRKESLLDLIKDKDVPLYFINGENNILAPFDRVKDLYSSLKNAKLYKSYNTGDILQKKNSIEINNILKDFLIK